MPIEYTKRDVQLVVDQFKTAIKSADDLRKLSPDRSLSVAITEAETAVLFLMELCNRTPERTT